jgi:SAM-dependent methyltransferase
MTIVLTKFESLYRRNLLRRMESVSGSGSTFEQTGELRAQLPALFRQLDVHSVLDAPCGDFNWMQHVISSIDSYTGIDIVPDIVDSNRSRYQSAARIFLTGDLCEDALPSVDLVLCRDCLVHFPYADIARAIDNFRRSGSRYLLMTTFPAHEANGDIITGEWRPLNFERAPFLFPPPSSVLNERCSEGSGAWDDKSLGLWLLKDLPAQIGPQDLLPDK